QDEKRKYQYLKARALYELKNYQAATPLFQELARAPASGSASRLDEWATQSRHLLLDIFNQKKNYQLIVENAGRWAKGQGKEGAEFQKIADQARFEWAASQGETSEALKVFL